MNESPYRIIYTGRELLCVASFYRLNNTCNDNQTVVHTAIIPGAMNESPYRIIITGRELLCVASFYPLNNTCNDNQTAVHTLRARSLIEPRFANESYGNC